jgi:5-methylcytosine-specific restriction protein A
MKFEVKDTLEILNAYELTKTGLLFVAKESTESPKLIVSLESDTDDEFPEGKELTRIHKSKERNSQVVIKKKEKVLRESGNLACEVCGFDFVKFYGQIGYGFAECHHIIPLSMLRDEQKTKLSDLAIVCANCHRILHKTRPLLSIQELRAIVKKNISK